MTFGAFAMTFRERQMISKIRTNLEIGFYSVCNDVLPKRHRKSKRHRKPSRTLTIEHDPAQSLEVRLRLYDHRKPLDIVGPIVGRVVVRIKLDGVPPAVVTGEKPLIEPTVALLRHK